MTTRAKKIVNGQQLATSAATYYTAPVNTSCVIKKLTFTNTSASTRLVTVYLISTGGSANDASTLSKVKSIAANETWECTEAENHVIEAGGFIQAFADAGASISIHGSGIEIV